MADSKHAINPDLALSPSLRELAKEERRLGLSEGDRTRSTRKKEKTYAGDSSDSASGAAEEESVSVTKRRLMFEPAAASSATGSGITDSPIPEVELAKKSETGEWTKLSEAGMEGVESDEQAADRHKREEIFEANRKYEEEQQKKEQDMNEYEAKLLADEAKKAQINAELKISDTQAREAFVKDQEAQIAACAAEANPISVE